MRGTVQLLLASVSLTLQTPSLHHHHDIIVLYSEHAVTTSMGGGKGWGKTVSTGSEGGARGWKLHVQPIVTWPCTLAPPMHVHVEGGWVHNYEARARL